MLRAEKELFGMELSLEDIQAIESLLKTEQNKFAHIASIEQNIAKELQDQQQPERAVRHNTIAAAYREHANEYETIRARIGLLAQTVRLRKGSKIVFSHVSSEPIQVE